MLLFDDCRYVVITNTLGRINRFKSYWWNGPVTIIHGIIIVIFIMYLIMRILTLIVNQCDVTFYEIFFGRCGTLIKNY